MLSNPQGAIAPITAQTRDQTSSNYNGLADSLRQQFMSTGGGGASGKFGTQLLAGNLARVGALSQADEQAGTNAVQAQQGGASLASNLLGMNINGTSTTGTTTGNTTGTSSGSGWNIGASAGVGYTGPTSSVSSGPNGNTSTSNSGGWFGH